MSKNEVDLADVPTMVTVELIDFMNDLHPYRGSNLPKCAHAVTLYLQRAEISELLHSPVMSKDELRACGVHMQEWPDATPIRDAQYRLWLQFQAEDELRELVDTILDKLDAAPGSMENYWLSCGICDLAA
mmetsp:Transcript_139134/g.312905  ORF Transcript_139134/g.312905 Transcript_139134/m.312905 type:complete len:130 (+) Transcript_139134:82-471(+)